MGLLELRDVIVEPNKVAREVVSSRYLEGRPQLSLLSLSKGHRETRDGSVSDVLTTQA